MPRRSILSAAERESLLALPDTKDDLIRHYTFSDTDLSIIRQRRGPANRLGFAVQLCYLRFPGIFLGVDQAPSLPLLKLVADQLKVGVESWDDYGQREQTRREHLVELQTVFGFQPSGRNPRPQLRAAALPGQRPQPGDGGRRVVEHGLSGARSTCVVERTPF
jgi:TnpA family transposase